MPNTVSDPFKYFVVGSPFCCELPVIADIIEHYATFIKVPESPAKISFEYRNWVIQRMYFFILCLKINWIKTINEAYSVIFFDNKSRLIITPQWLIILSLNKSVVTIIKETKTAFGKIGDVATVEAGGRIDILEDNLAFIVKDIVDKTLYWENHIILAKINQSIKTWYFNALTIVINHCLSTLLVNKKIVPDNTVLAHFP